MVPKAGLEPAQLSPLPPQDSVSTNSTTWAYSGSIKLFFFRDDFIRLPVQREYRLRCPGLPELQEHRWLPARLRVRILARWEC